MGRRRFRLADMMPNSWFYKLRDMRRPRGRPAPAAAGSRPAASAMLPSSSPPTPRWGARSAARPASPTPRRGSVAVAFPHRTSYYYPTRHRELPAPEPKTDATEEEEEEEEDRRQRQLLPQQQSPPRCSRRRHRVGAVRVGRGLDAPAAGARDAPPRSRRDMCVGVGRDGSTDEDDVVDEVRRPAVIAPPSDYSMSGKVIASETDIVIDLCSDGTAERVLRPIVTRPAMREVVRYDYELKGVDVADKTPATPAGGSSASEQGSKQGHAHPRRPSVSVGRRLRTRVSSPRLAASTATARSRKSKPATTTTPGAASPRKTTTTTTTPAAAPLAESFAVVKSSADPRRDFRESMEEMIAEKRIRDDADLEDLLACYLALNAAEHHGLIVEVFEEIWATIARRRRRRKPTMRRNDGDDGQE